MPTAADSLTPESSPDDIQRGISACIKQMMDEGGRSQEQVIAICHSEAEKATGRPVQRKSTTVGS